MFIKLTHGLHSIINAIVSYIQRWTDDSVPDNTKTLHNFKDGLGKRPAVPLDELNSSNNIVNVKTDSKFEHGTDDVTSSENVLKVELKTELANGKDNLTNKIGIENTVCVPEPVIFEIQNEVPDKIEKVVPIKTQALPGQDFIFKILYVKDYNYIEGDILPVFGTWGNYARLSKDGKYLTVNSNADLSVRLILTPAPQDWIPEKPDPSIIQQAGDRMLNTIPRDGAKAEYTIEEMKIEDNFYTVSIENQATTFVTNGDFSNGKYYNVNAKENKITIPMTFSEGFDENAIYWKCYDDPKSATPVTGYYPSKDYNEEFGPLPDGFRKLRYLYGDGNPYIDLGIKLKKDYKVKILMEVSNNTSQKTRALFGARNSTNTEWSYDRTDGAYSCYVRYSSYNTIGFQRGTIKTYTTNSIDMYNTPKWFYSTGTSFEVQNYDGTLLRKNTIADGQNIDTEWNCYLFTVNDKGNPYAYGAQGYMYRCEIWDENDNLIMRLIPAKNLDTNSCGMYDIVNNKFYYNQRPMASFSGPEFYVWQKQMQTSDHNNVMTLQDTCTNDLLKVKIPSEYKKLYGVYFRECYLNTNYKVKKDDTIITCVTINNSVNSNSYKCLFGTRSASPSNDMFAFYSRFNGQNVPNYGRNNVWNYGINIVYDKPIKIVLGPNKASLYTTNDESSKFEEIIADGTGTDSTNNLWLGCCNQNGSRYDWGYVTFHYFKIYDKDGNLVLDYVPARRVSDSAIGFYNTVNNTFVARTGGNNYFEERTGGDCLHYNLIIENITKDINLGIIRNPVYDNPFKLEDCIEDEQHNEPKDSLIYTYEITDSKILDYFYYVDHVNNATDYATLDSTYKTANLGNPATFTVSYKSGYDNYDIKCTANTDAKITIGKTHYITYNELDIPAEYTPVKGLYTNNSSTYFKTGYIPKWDDKVVCYCSITRDSSPSYPCYVFGARNGVNNKSFVFYAHRSSSDNRYSMGYDRCCGETDIRDIVNNELMKITADNNGCECDFAYTKTKINTEMYQIPHVPDYNQDVTLPDTYEKLGYIENTSSIYADLGFKLNRLDKVEIICNINSNNDGQYRCLFGGRQNYNPVTNCYGFWIRVDYTNKPSYSRTVGTAGTDFVYNKDIKLITDSTSAAWYNITTGEKYNEIIVPEATQNCNYNCYLFVMNNSGSLHDGYAKGRISSFKVYNENNELIQYFVPARRKSDNIAGLYNVITNTFITGRNGNFSWSRINYQDYPDCDYEMYLFGCNNANSRNYGYYGNMYKFTIYNGDNKPAVNMVPVKRISDSVLGFYDTIRRIFITPAGGSVTEATEPTYKGNIVVTNIPNDTTITITKNNDSRKTIVLEEGIEDDVFHQQIDQLEYNYELKNTKLEDWLYTVKYINNAQSICSLAGEVATYYNVPRVGSNTRFPVTYNVGTDDNMIEATATAGATVEITKPIEIIYNHFPNEYIEIYGIRNNNTRVYFEIPYKIKANDTVKLYVSDEKSSYTYYIFGSGINEIRGCVLCSRYENYNNNMFYSRNKRVNITGPQNEVLEIVCKPHGIDYTNGYDDYSYTLDNIPDDSDTMNVFHLFGACLNSYNGKHASSFTGTIYKCTISDENGIKVNLVPVKRKADGAIGFYDTVGDAFYLPNDNGSLSIAAAPKLKGRIIVSNITDDTDVIVTQKTQPSPSMNINDSIDYSYNIEGCSLTDYWHYITINNTTNGELTFTNAVYGGNCYTCLHTDSITMPCSYKAGRASTDFIVSEGTLTNNGLVLNNVKDDKNITVMLNDYHDPKSDTNDDLNIFTNPDFSNFNQYRVVNGTDLMLTNYSFINSQVAAMNNKQIFEFNINELDILSFDPNNIPGEKIKTKIVSSDTNMNEVVQNVTIDGKLMYKHTVTLKNQIKLENGKVYMFKVRDNTDTGKLIAYAKDTGSYNLVNSNGEYIIEDDNLYFKWDEPNKYIVKGNKTIYFELNGIKL